MISWFIANFFKIKYCSCLLITWLKVYSLHNIGLLWQTSLEDLRLRKNNISNDIVSFLSNLEHLRSLDLSYNHLEGSLDISG